jgi:hypothetical protein
VAFVRRGAFVGPRGVAVRGGWWGWGRWPYWGWGGGYPYAYAPYYYYPNPVYYYSTPPVTENYYYYPVPVQPSEVMPYAPSTAIAPTSAVVVPSAASEQVQPVPADGTYDYDGGPANPVPAPRVVPAPAAAPASPAPVPARQVALPQRQTQPLHYRAYGEQPAATPTPAVNTYLASRVVR